MARAAREARELGFDGKWCIHPEQVGAINEAFSSTEAELGWAHAVRDALGEGAVSGDGAVRVQGAMVDEAMRAHAERLLALPGRSAVSRVALEGPPYFEDVEVGQVARAERCPERC